jgi:TolB-like protein/Tfp pilus assembly protein PilF
VVSPVVRSLAVLPLQNLSGDKDQEYFVDGMTDALTTDLAQVGSLRVISRTSAMHFKGSNETLPRIGRALNVDAIVEGTVTRSEDRVRVTAQLVEANTDHHLWARTYERDLKNILSLQDELAQDITEQIRAKLTPKERGLLTQVHAVDPETYDATLRGWYWLNQPTTEGAHKAFEYFQKAIAQDANYAPAYAGLAETYLCSCFSAYLSHKEGLTKAKAAAVKALALDPSLAEAHTAIGIYKFFVDWDWEGAEAEFRRATTLNTNNASAHYWYSFYLVPMGRLDDAMTEINRARSLDPFSVTVTNWLGQVLYHERKYDEALRQNQRGLEMYPEQGQFYWEMADVFEQKKMFADAFAARQKALKLRKDTDVTPLDQAYKRSGYTGYLLTQAQTLGADNPAYSAHVYAVLGDEARTMTALETAYNQRNPGILFMRTAPEFDIIRSSARFQDLVRRIGFPMPPTTQTR